MENIIKSLEVWRSDRNITTCNQRLVFLKNSLEEFSELQNAKSEHDKIDALCDLAIVALNSFNISTLRLNKLLDEVGSCEEAKLKDYIVYLNENEINPELYLAFLLNMLKEFGYCYLTCLNETIAEISSRRQCPKQKEEWAIKGVVGKWQKDKSQADLYKANYEKGKKWAM